MERGSKRKAAALSAPPAADARPSKRQKTPDSSTGEMPETVTRTGLYFVEQLRTAADKTGRLIADAFLHLPGKKQYPDYYDQIKLPIAVDTIENKLENRQYNTLAEVEGDIKRMVVNAKQYNEPKSEVYNDAERVRKMAFNYMKMHNPAYKKIRDYTAVATPIPDEMPSEKTTKLRLTAPTKKTPAPETERPSRNASTPAAQQKRSESAKPNDEPVPSEDASRQDIYQGLSFQDAQDKIIDDLINYIDPQSEELAYGAFVTLPKRVLKDYYAIIKHPTSLKGIQKRIQGWRSREEQTGATDFKSWDAFEGEVARIWQNAREYNEDGSEIHLLAGAFEKDFKQRLAVARKVVEEPAQTKLKLNMSETKAAAKSGLKLNLGSQKPSPAPGSGSAAQPWSGSPTNTKPAMNGTTSAAQLARNPANQARSTASPALSAKAPNGIPAPAPQINGAMLPPAATARPSSSSHTMAPPQTFPQQTHYNPPVYHQPANSFDSKWRAKVPTKPDGTPGDPDILMSKLHVATHPDLPVAMPFRIAVPASKVMSQQSVTATLNSQHAVIRLTAELAEQLKGPNPRPYRLFVSNNGIRQSQRVVQDYNYLQNGMVNGNYGNAVQKEKDKAPSWDVRLMSGTNRIEVECVAAAKAGAANNDLVMEKTSLFVFQLKA